MKWLSALSDDELLVRLSDALKESRCREAVLVAHIAAVDARRLFAREAAPSMFRFCLDVLHLSEAQAYRRITAARLSRRFPALLTMLEDGRLHLCGIAVIAKHLTEANGEEVLARATHKSKRELEELVAEWAPKPDVPPKIRKKPQPKAQSGSSKPSKPSDEQREERAEAHGEPGEPGEPGENEPPPARETAPEKRPTVAPLSPARYQVTFTASAELRDKLERLEALIPGSDLASVIDAAVSEKLERLEAKRFGKTKNPRTNVEDADTSPGVRGIAAAVKRFVWVRDGGQCTFVAHDGRRCPERNRLEYHHEDPYGMDSPRQPSGQNTSRRKLWAGDKSRRTCSSLSRKMPNGDLWSRWRPVRGASRAVGAKIQAVMAIAFVNAFSNHTEGEASGRGGSTELAPLERQGRTPDCSERTSCTRVSARWLGFFAHRDATRAVSIHSPLARSM